MLHFIYLSFEHSTVAPVWVQKVQIGDSIIHHCALKKLLFLAEIKVHEHRDTLTDPRLTGNVFTCRVRQCKAVLCCDVYLMDFTKLFLKLFFNHLLCCEQNNDISPIFF